MPHLRLRVSVTGDDGVPVPVPVVAVPTTSQLVELLPTFPLQDGDLLRVDLSADVDGYLMVLIVSRRRRPLYFSYEFRGTARFPANQSASVSVPIGMPDYHLALVVIWMPTQLLLGAEEWWSRLTAPQLDLDGEAVLLRFSPSREEKLPAPETRGKKYPTTRAGVSATDSAPLVELPSAIKKRRPPKRSTPTADAVDCTVFAPPQASPGEVLFVQVFAHSVAETDAAARMARDFDATAERRGFTSLELDVPYGTRLTFHFAMAGLSIEDPVQTLVWKGRTAAVQFAAAVLEGTLHGKQIGTVTISQDGTPIGHIKFVLTIAAASSAKPEPLGEHAQRYRRVFISYASRDRTEVLKRVQMLDRFRVSYFQDLLSLEPGVRWEKELYKHIDQCDLFLLFWSSAARDSEWVLKEVRYAIERKGGQDANPPEIMPVILEGPPPVVPPEDLQHFHFNDKLRYFMDVPTS